MKKTVLTVATAVLFVMGSATFISCGNTESHDTDHHEHAEGEEHSHDDVEASAEAQYQCPMKCEEEKTYDEAVQCPVCGMDTKEVE